MYIDRLLDSSLPHNLLQEYGQIDGSNGKGMNSANGTAQPDVPPTITEEPSPQATGSTTPEANGNTQKFKRTPKDIYRVNEDETTPLLPDKAADDEEQISMPPDLVLEEETGSQSRVVTVAIVSAPSNHACYQMYMLTYCVLLVVHQSCR